MSRNVKKKAISLVGGLSIVGGTIATAVVLTNMMYAGTTTFSIETANLNNIYDQIISNYGVNAIDSSLTLSEFKEKVEDGSVRKWILDNYKNYFIGDNSDNELNFNLSFNDNTLIFTPLRNIKFNFKYSSVENNLNIELKNNQIYMHFNNFDFLQVQYLSNLSFDLFKSNLLSNMQNNKITFQDLINVNDEQKIQIKNWVSKIFNLGDIFDSVSFEPYSLSNNDLFSLKLKPSKYYIFALNIGNSNSAEYQVFKNELVINFLKTITLSDNVLTELFNKVNEFIWEQRIDYYDWVKHFSQKDNKYNEFKQFIYNKLNPLLNNQLNSINDIGDLSLSNNNGIFSLNFSGLNGYSFISKSEYFSNGNVVLSGLEFYRFIQFSTLNFTNFFNSLQSFILDNKYTNQEFANWFNNDSFKDFVSKNLSSLSGNLINLELIGDVSYDVINNRIEISPAVMYKFEELSSSRNLTVDYNGNIIISNLEYFTLINLTKLDTLFDVVQNLVIQQQFTNEEFEDYINNNQQEIKSLIANNLYIDSSNLIVFNQVKNVEYNDNNLIITLTPPDKKKYTIDENKNITLSTNTLTISNLEYFTITNFTNLNSLHEAIQQTIIDNKLTTYEFQQYVEDNQYNLINLIANNLYTSDNNQKLPVDQISSLTYINESLRINLLAPKNIKYSIDKNKDITLSNDMITVCNFTYFTDVRLTKLDILHNAIQNFISNKMFTSSDFGTYIQNNLDEIKNLVANNLFISNVSTISQTLISNVSYDDENIQIALSVPRNIKYSANLYPNTSLNENLLTISNFTYFTTKGLVVNNLYNSIQELINTQKATSSEFQNYINQNQNLLKLTIVNNITGLTTTDEIPNVKFNNYNIEITLKPSLNTKFILYNSTSNISLVDNLLTISNLTYFNNTTLVNINNLYSSIQDLISRQKFTENEFGNYININQSQIKDLVANNLFVANNVAISSTEISSINFDNNTFNINISPKAFTKYNLDNSDNWTLNNNVLSLKNFTYYTIVELVKLNDTFNVVQNKITSSKFTNIEFENYVQNNLSEIKALMENNLYVSQTSTIGIDKISSIQCYDGNLQVYLNPDANIKYGVSTNDKWALNNNVLTFKNLTYFTNTNLVKFSRLFDSLQTLIVNQKLSISELSNYINQNQASVKELVSDSLYTSTYLKIPSNQIGSITGNSNGNIIINLNAPINVKYNPEENSKVSFNSLTNQITVSNFSFFDQFIVNQTQLTNFTNAFNQYVQDEKLTTNQLSTSQLKSLISTNFNIPTTNFSIKHSQGISEGLTNLVISPEGYNKFYSSLSIYEQTTGEFIINDLKTFKVLNFTSSNASLNYNIVQKWINNLAINNSTDLNNNLESLISNCLDEIIYSSSNSSLPINSINLKFNYSSSSITAVLSPNDSNYYKFNYSSSVNNVSFINGQLNFSNLKYYTPNPPPSQPLYYFIISGTKLMGLTPTGLSANQLTLPSNITEIAASVFTGNKNLKSIDMSLTKIKSIPNSQTGTSGGITGMFTGCTNLKSIILPSTLNYVGTFAFSEIPDLDLIKFNSTNISFGNYTFEKTKISTFPISYGVTNKIVMAMFSEFTVKDSTEMFTLPSYISNIVGYGFWNFNTKIFKITNSNITIDKFAFGSDGPVFNPILIQKIIVPNQTVKQRLINSGFRGTIEIG